jgi:hypothetical protein
MQSPLASLQMLHEGINSFNLDTPGGQFIATRDIIGDGTLCLHLVVAASNHPIA